jgi:8-oxo-dGTP diphosphatase
VNDDIVRVAAAVILRPDGQVLLAQRPPGKAYAGYWEFPGGKFEPGESPRAALDRELFEELGLTVRRAAPWFVQRYVYPHAHVELHFFRVFAFDGEPVGHDGQAFRVADAGWIHGNADASGEHAHFARAHIAAVLRHHDGRRLE